MKTIILITLVLALVSAKTRGEVTACLISADVVAKDKAWKDCVTAACTTEKTEI